MGLINEGPGGSGRSGERVRSLAVLHRRGLLLCLGDATAWIGALTLATFLQFEFRLLIPSEGRFFALLLLTTLAHGLAAGAFGVYTGRQRPGSFDEAYAIGLATAVAGVLAATFDQALGRPMPLSSAVAAAPMALVAMASGRYLLRFRAEREICPPSDAGSRVIVVGAGDGATRLIEAMRRDPERPYLPVALLDDDPSKRRLRIAGVPVLGTRGVVKDVARATGADMLIVAIPSAEAGLIRAMADRAEEAGLQFRVLPSVRELFDGQVHVNDVRPASYADLLGRREVAIDIDEIASYLTGRRVLITGAGGSIGSELSRQVHRFRPASLVLLDRDESALHAVQLSIDGRALMDSRDLVVADIRDRQRLREVFEEHRPQVVFHAAALKHLPLLEMYPEEAVKTNIWGTWHVLEAAANVGVERFVNISTDKAADPISVLGYSKRIAERLTSWFSLRIENCLSVRFGNVLGSRGSVLTAFQAQIVLGGPITVTHPEVTRYFMTVEEAVRLVIQAGAVGRSGEALILDMGQPIKIADVARRLAEDSGGNVDVEFSGLRPGEKLHEVLLAGDEVDNRPVHELISHVSVPALSPADVRELDPSSRTQDLVNFCKKVAVAPVTVDANRVILPHRHNEAPSRRTSDTFLPH